MFSDSLTGPLAPTRLLSFPAGCSAQRVAIPRAVDVPRPASASGGETPLTSLVLAWCVEVTQKTHHHRHQLLARGKTLAAARAEMLDAAGEDAAFRGGVVAELDHERFPTGQGRCNRVRLLAIRFPGLHRTSLYGQAVHQVLKVL